MFLDQLLFELSCKKHTHRNTHTHTHTHTDAHKDSDKSFIVAFCKYATIIKMIAEGATMSTDFVILCIISWNHVYRL